MFQRGSILNMKPSGRLNSVMTSFAENHWNQRESILESEAMAFVYPRRDSNPDYRRERAVNLPLFDRDMPPRIRAPRRKPAPSVVTGSLSYDN